MRISYTLIFLGSLLILISSGPAEKEDDNNSEFYNRNLFLKSAIGRLTGNVPSEWVEEVQYKTVQWQNVPIETNWIDAIDAVTCAAMEYQVVSDVTISTLPKNGATIRYQTVGQRNRDQTPITAKEVTTCIETIPIGMYHIWSVRNGKTTSDKSNTYKILKIEEKVQISEKIVSSK